MKPWLAKETVSKIDILGSDYQEVLLRLVDKENLPASLGGECTCEGEGGCDHSFAGPWKEDLEERRARRRKEAEGSADKHDEKKAEAVATEAAGGDDFPPEKVAETKEAPVPTPAPVEKPKESPTSASTHIEKPAEAPASDSVIEKSKPDVIPEYTGEGNGEIPGTIPVPGEAPVHKEPVAGVFDLATQAVPAPNTEPIEKPQSVPAYTGEGNGEIPGTIPVPAT